MVEERLKVVPAAPVTDNHRVHVGTPQLCGPRRRSWNPTYCQPGSSGTGRGQSGSSDTGRSEQPDPGQSEPTPDRRGTTGGDQNAGETGTADGSPQSAAAELKKWVELHEQGIIIDEELEQKNRNSSESRPERSVRLAMVP